MIYIHGFQDTGERDFSAMAIRAAYRQRNDHNVLTVDWVYYSKSFFYSNAVIPQLKIVTFFPSWAVCLKYISRFARRLL